MTKPGQLESSAASRMTGITLQPAGQDVNTDFSEKPSSRESTDLEEAAPPPAVNQSDAPDGGFTAWLVVLGVWCTSFCSFGWINCVGVFQEYYQEVLLSQYSPSTIAWIPSLQIFFMTATGPFLGVLYDKYGPLYLILAGTFLHVFGLMMTSLGKEYYQILLGQGVCSAIGVSAIFQPALNTVHGWFDKKRGAAFGIVSTGSSLGGVILPILVTRLIRQNGFPWAMRICAFLILGLLIIANLTVRPRHPPTPKPFHRVQFAKPFREPEFLLLITGFFLFTYGIYVPIDYLPVQALRVGMDPNLVQYLIPILNAASLFGRVLSGILGDRIGKYNIFIVVGYLTGLWILALWITESSNAGIIAFASLFGFCSGAYVSLIAPLVSQISPLPEIGFRTGIVFFISSIPGLTTNPLNGAIIDQHDGLTKAKVFAGVFCLGGTSFILASRVYRMGWKLNVVF